MVGEGTLPAQVSAIPIGMVEPHPRLKLRFRYDVDTLAESIRSSIDENTPNGQLNPGRVVPRKDGRGYYVYIGMRRYFALKLLYEKTRDERFATYSAYIDTNVSELQMFIKAKRENDEERGERKGLSVLEEVSGLSRIKDSISDPKELDKPLARRLEVAQVISEERLRRLYDIEDAVHFRFGISHLENLGKIKDAREFYLVAACVAEYEIGAEKMELAYRGQNSAFAFAWFQKVFPELRAEEAGSASGSATAAGQEQTTQGITTASSSESRQGSDSAAADLEIREKSVIVIKCPTCRSENMVRVTGSVEVMQLPAKPDGEGFRAVAESVSRFGLKCGACDGEFYALLMHLEGREYAVEALRTKKALREPTTTVRAVDLRFDREKRVWQRITGRDVSGTVAVGEEGAATRR